MVFKWLKNATTASRDATEESRIESGTWTEDSLETLAFFMRTFGHGGFDTESRTAEELLKDCEHWSSHLLEQGGPSDWKGLRVFFRQARSEEHTFITSTREKTRDLVADMVSGLRGTLAADAHADSVVSDAMDELKHASDKGDLDALRRCADHAVTAVKSAIRERSARQRAELKRLTEQVAQMRGDLAAAQATAQIDGLTQVYNRSSLDAYLASMVGSPAHHRWPTCLLMLDVDHFKAVNDNYGHHTGDLLLRSVADAMMQACRRGSSFVARYGGDEFAVVLREADLASAHSVAQRLLTAIRAIKVATAPEVYVTSSIGIAQLQPDDTVETWLTSADDKLYEAKRNGRDQAA